MWARFAAWVRPAWTNGHSPLSRMMPQRRSSLEGRSQGEERWFEGSASFAARYFGKRVLQTVATLLGVSVLTFALVPLAPGSPARAILLNVGNQPPSDEEVRALEKELGLDRPLPVQYVDWLSDVVRGDLGRSFGAQQPVSSQMAPRIRPTLLLGGVALGLALLMSVVGALIAAIWVGRPADAAIRGFALLATSVPAFFVGLLLLQYLVVKLGVGLVIADGTVRTVWMPAVVLALPTAAVWSRILRALLLEALSAKFSLMATARGAGRLRVALVHALPNAFVPFLGFVGLGIGGIIGGAVVIETVFSWPGMGVFAVNSIFLRDIPVIQAFVLLATFAYVLSSFLVDVVVFLLDPRLRTRPVVR